MSDTEITKTVEENEEIVEKPTKKPRKPYVMTEARKLAFEKCREKRQAKVKAIQDEKLLKASEVIKQKREQEIIPSEPTEIQENVAVGLNDQRSDEKVKPKAKKTKKVVVYQSESSESDSDTSIEIEVVRKKKSKPVKENPIQESHNTALNTLISWV